MVERTNLSDAVENLGNFPLRQTKLSTGRHSGYALPAAEEPGFAEDRSGVLRDGVSETKLKLKILCEELLIISQRFFGIQPFRFYALADGIHNILSRSSPSPPGDPPQTPQLLLGWEE